jgi:hypothetical protein
MLCWPLTVMMDGAINNSVYNGRRWWRRESSEPGSHRHLVLISCSNCFIAVKLLLLLLLPIFYIFDVPQSFHVVMVTAVAGVDR